MTLDIGWLFTMSGDGVARTRPDAAAFRTRGAAVPTARASSAVLQGGACEPDPGAVVGVGLDRKRSTAGAGSRQAEK